MTTYATEVLDGQGSKLPFMGRPGVVMVHKAFDFSDSRINSGNGTVQNDVVALLAVPAGSVVVGTAAECKAGQDPDELSANLDDLDIGDGANSDGWHDGLDLTAAEFEYSGFPDLAGPGGSEAYHTGKVYTTADTIDLLQNTNATVVTGVLRLRVFFLDMGDFPVAVKTTNGL